MEFGTGADDGPGWDPALSGGWMEFGTGADDGPAQGPAPSTAYMEVGYMLRKGPAPAPARMATTPPFFLGGPGGNPARLILIPL